MKLSSGLGQARASRLWNSSSARRCSRWPASLSSGALHQSFSTLAEALQVLSRLRHWLVIEKSEISEGVEYTASTRLRLDPSQMAKTFQVSALSNRDWNPSSEWLTWSFFASDSAVPEAASKDGK